MKNTLVKFRKRNIQANIYHFLLVIFVVALSVCLSCGLCINYFTLNGAIENYNAKSSLASCIVETDEFGPLDKTFFDSNFQYGTRLEFESNVTVGSKTYVADIIVADGSVSIPYIVDGKKGVGCFVDIYSVEKYNFGINYSQVSFDFELDAQTKTLPFNVIGSVAMAEKMIKTEKLTIFIDEQSFVKILSEQFEGVAEDDFSVIKYNQVLIKNSVSDEDVQKIENYYESSTSNLLALELLDDLESYKTIKNEVKQAKIMSYTFPLLFLLVSILAVVSTISQMLVKERYNIGLLKSFGVGNGSLVSNYSGYGAFFCFVGAILGLLLAPLIVPNITFESYDKMYILPRELVKLICPWWLIVTFVVAAVIIGYFSALFVVVKIVNKTPKECMSRTIKIKLKSRKKRSKLPTLMSVSMRNIRVNPSRTILGIISIGGGALLCLIGFGVESIYGNNKEIVQLQSLNTFAQIFKTFSFILVFVSLIIIIIQIFKERIRELALLRLNGNGRFKMWITIFYEMIFVSIFGLCVAFVLCQPTMILIFKLFNKNVNFVVDFMCYFKVFISIILMVCAVSILGFIRICKLSLTDTLKNPD